MTEYYTITPWLKRVPDTLPPNSDSNLGLIYNERVEAPYAEIPIERDTGLSRCFIQLGMAGFALVFRDVRPQ
jgi:hypothetical protein